MKTFISNYLFIVSIYIPDKSAITESIWFHWMKYSKSIVFFGRFIIPFSQLSYCFTLQVNETEKLLSWNYSSVQRSYKSDLFSQFFFHPLSANGELSRHENSTFLWTWILRWVPRSSATYASLCNTLSSNKPNVQKQWKSWNLKG